MLANRKESYIEYQSEVVQPPVAKPKKVPKSKVNPWGRYFFMVLIAVAIALSVTGRYAAMARTGYEIAKLKYAVTALEKENEALRLNVAGLKAPGRVQEIATTRLGMQLPDKVYYASVASAAAKPAVKETVQPVATVWGINKAEARSGR